MRVIAHVDLDAFYAQVEQQHDPTLAGQPVAVVQHNSYQGGAIIALSYEAKCTTVFLMLQIKYVYFLRLYVVVVANHDTRSQRSEAEYAWSGGATIVRGLHS